MNSWETPSSLLIKSSGDFEPMIATGYGQDRPIATYVPACQVLEWTGIGRGRHYRIRDAEGCEERHPKCLDGVPGIHVCMIPPPTEVRQGARSVHDLGPGLRSDAIGG